MHEKVQWHTCRSCKVQRSAAILGFSKLSCCLLPYISDGVHFGPWKGQRLTSTICRDFVFVHVEFPEKQFQVKIWQQVIYLRGDYTKHQKMKAERERSSLMMQHELGYCWGQMGLNPSLGWRSINLCRWPDNKYAGIWGPYDLCHNSSVWR